MAHQSHHIPWNTLASNFKYVFERPRDGYRTNLVPLLRPGQGKQLEYFVTGFARNVKQFSTTEKAKYSLSTEPIQPSDTFLDGDTLAAIRKSLEYIRKENEMDRRWWYRWCWADHWTCSCSWHIMDDPYTYEPWLRLCLCVECCCKSDHTWMVDLPKILLMHRRMEPLLRLASHPEVHLERCFSPWTLYMHEHGWSGVLRAALYAYIGLNVLFLKPETWPSRSQAATLQQDKKPLDYRLTAMYQKMVHKCVASRALDVESQPHRLFYGIPRSFLLGQFKENAKGNDFEKERTSDKLLLGRFPLSAQFEDETRGIHLPTKDDVYLVQDILWLMGLPKELILDIMDFAEYEPQARLTIPSDPLHPDNSNELYKYLSYCWRMLIQCDVLADVCSKAICWEQEVRDCLKHLFFDYPDRPELPRTDTEWNWDRGEWIDFYAFWRFI